MSSRDRTGVLAELFRWTLLLVALALMGPGRLAGQVEPTRPELRRLLEAARFDYNGAVEAFGVLDGQYDRAVRDYNLYSSAGDEQRAEAAFQRIQALSDELRAQERRVAELREDLNAARRLYIEAQGEYLDGLLRERDRARSRQDSLDLGALIQDATNEYRELQLDAEDPTVSAPSSSVATRDPRDTPADLRQKASLEDHRARQWEVYRAQVEVRLGELREAQRKERSARDFLTGLGRFGDTSLPTGPPTTANPTNRDPSRGPPGADSIGSGRALTLEEKIASLEAQEELATERIRLFQSNAAQYRRWAGGGGA